jgi:hypothetical protein
MAKMALVACLFSACMNYTRDGKNPEDELMGKMARRNTGNPQGTGSTKISVLAHCRGLGWSRVQQWCSQVLLLPASCVREWKEWKKDP